MARFMLMRRLQKCAAHASVHNHFDHDRSPERRSRFNDLRQTALIEWREVLSAQAFAPLAIRDVSALV